MNLDAETVVREDGDGDGDTDVRIPGIAFEIGDIEVVSPAHEDVDRETVGVPGDDARMTGDGAIARSGDAIGMGGDAGVTRGDDVAGLLAVRGFSL
ncbi:hypothetical protein [Chondromyces crocatus]|uniref:Uncharacterized protein n=1 Tax=Chondromyces crocatus TaxID=52 RepID=A0A0K1EA83_CHOCO|nr:hypothetical protein [Chondromyces crocatus]AKT37791.1 uncharacterized protein CMC5_019330 [Chondromyces crocatus]